MCYALLRTTILSVDKQTKSVSTNIYVDNSLFSGDGMLVQGPEYCEYVDHLVHLCTPMYAVLKDKCTLILLTHVLYHQYYSVFMSMYKYLFVYNEHTFII